MNLKSSLVNKIVVTLVTLIWLFIIVFNSEGVKKLGTSGHRGNLVV